VIHRPRATATLVVALLLAAAAPAVAIAPATATASATTAAGVTPLDTNLLWNASFNRTPTTGQPVPGWTVEGDMHVETFGTRSWPYPAYGRKYNGGARYLACGKGSGLVRQTVDIKGLSDRSYKLRAKLWVQFGGVIGHKIRVSVRATGGGPEAYGEKAKTMDITYHYKVAVAAITLPTWTEHLEVEIKLMRKAGASKCWMVVDPAKLTLFKV